MTQKEIKRWFSENRKKVAVVASTSVLALGAVGLGAWYLGGDTDSTPVVEAEVDKALNVKKTETRVDYLKYVKGLKDWTVATGEKVDFMGDVTWDKGYVSGVSVDSSKVDLSKEGTYSLMYTVRGKDSKEVDRKVLKQVVVKSGSGEVAKAEEDKKAEVKAENKGTSAKKEEVKKAENKSTTVASAKPVSTTSSKSAGHSTASKPVSKPTGNSTASKPVSKPAGNTTKPVTPAPSPSKPATPAPSPSKPSPSKPAHTHSWQPQYKNHPAEPAKTHTEDHGHYETVVDAPEKQEWRVDRIEYYPGCRICGWEYPDNPDGSGDLLSTPEALRHEMYVHNFDPNCGWQTTAREVGHWETIPAQTHQEWIPNVVTITDAPAKPAWQEHIGDKCTGCGATR